MPIKIKMYGLFLLLTVVTAKFSKKELISQSFGKLDTNKDGVLSITEAKPFVAYNMDLKIGEIDNNMIKGLDEDGERNGPDFSKMSRTEFTKMFEEQPESMVMEHLKKFMPDLDEGHGEL